MGERVFRTEELQPPERIRSAVWDIEMIAHDNLGEHSGDERIVLEFDDQTEVRRRREFTRITLPEHEDAGLCPTLIVTDGEQEPRYYCWVDYDQVWYYATGASEPERDNPERVTEMADRLDWLRNDLLEYPDYARIDGRLLPASRPGRRRLGGGTQPTGEFAIGEPTPTERVWRLIGQIDELAHNGDYDDHEMGEALEYEYIDRYGVRHFRRVMLLPSDNEGRLPILSPGFTRQDGDAEQSYFMIDDDVTWYWPASGDQTATRELGDTERLIVELQVFLDLFMRHPQFFHISYNSRA